MSLCGKPLPNRLTSQGLKIRKITQEGYYAKASPVVTPVPVGTPPPPRWPDGAGAGASTGRHGPALVAVVFHALQRDFT